MRDPIKNSQQPSRTFLSTFLYQVSPIGEDGLNLLDIMRLGQVNKELNIAITKSFTCFSSSTRNALDRGIPIACSDNLNFIAAMQNLDAEITFEDKFLQSGIFEKLKNWVRESGSVYFLDTPFVFVLFFLDVLNSRSGKSIKLLRRLIYSFNMNNKIPSNIIAQKCGLKNYQRFYEKFYSVALCLWAFYAESWKDPSTMTLYKDYPMRYETAQNFIKCIFSFLDPLFNIKVTRNLLSKTHIFLNHFKQEPTIELQDSSNENSLINVYFRMDNKDRELPTQDSSFITMNIEQFAGLLDFYAFNPKISFHNFYRPHEQRSFESSFLKQAIQEALSIHQPTPEYQKLKYLQSIITIQSAIRRCLAYQEWEGLPLKRLLHQINRLEKVQKEFNSAADSLHPAENAATLATKNLHDTLNSYEKASNSYETALKTGTKNLNDAAAEQVKNHVIEIEKSITQAGLIDKELHALNQSAENITKIPTQKRGHFLTQRLVRLSFGVGFLICFAYVLVKKLYQMVQLSF